MTDIKFTDLDIRGTLVPIQVNENSGRFVATMNGKYFADETFDGLRQQLMTASRRKAAKVSIPISRVTAGLRGRRNVIHGTATGIHASNGHVLARWENGRSEQLGWSDSSSIYPQLSPGQAEKLLALMQASEDAQRALREFDREIKFKQGLSKAVEDAVNEAAKEVE